ncbi:MAG TPA: L,D-transpeptidase [Symbiobacteriaceae bacterium]
MWKHRLWALAVAAAAALVLTGCQVGAGGTPANGGQRDPGTGDRLEAKLARAFGTVADYEPVGDGYVVLSPVTEGRREVAYLLPDGSGWKVAGARQTVPDESGDATLQVQGDMVVVRTTREGAPQFAGFRVGPEGLEPVDYYAAIAPDPAVKEGPFLLVNKYLNVLWYYEDGKLVKAYRVATGRQTEGPAPTWDDYRTNFFTPEGTFRVTNFVVNPAYHGMKPGDEPVPGGHPDNPLGTRWMGFSVLEGDGAGIWGLHGTNEPDKIGMWVSDGCIRLRTEEAEELFDHIVGRNPVLQVVAR